MRYRIQQVSANVWELVDHDGVAVGSFTDTEQLTGYDQAVLMLASLIGQSLRAAATDGNADDGLLAEGWVSDQGVAFSERLAGGRDFTSTNWLWRDPNVATVPLMLQTETDFGHFGAELAGFASEISRNGGTIASRGRFYNTEIGVQAHDLLLDGRSFGVSVDPGESTEVEESFTCTAQDDEGFCTDGDYSMLFLTYEIIGITMTPFQGFPRAAIKLDTNAAAVAVVTEAEAIVASAAQVLDVPVRPPASFFTLATPRPGEPFLDGVGDDYLVDQGDGTFAVPLTIIDEGPHAGLVFGHVARAAACHIGEPWGAGVCASPPPSMSAYANFHTGHVVCADGSDIPTGVLTVGCEHAPETGSPWQAMDFYANAGSGWADVRVVDDEWGSWACGALRPTVTDIELRVLRALALSGDWRDIGGHLEMIGALAVNGPGLPIKRELITASRWPMVASPALRASSRNGRPTVLQAAGMVARCADCQKRRAEASNERPLPVRTDPRIDAVLAAVEKIERRTRHLVDAEVMAMRARLTRS